MKAKEKTGVSGITPNKAKSTDSGKLQRGETTKSHRCKTELVLKGDNTCPIEIPRDEYEHLDKIHRCICDAAVKEGDFVIVDMPGVCGNDRQ